MIDAHAHLWLKQQGKVNGMPGTEGTDGIKLCGGRLRDIDLTKHEAVFRLADRLGLFIAIDMADGDAQVGSLREMILPRG